MSVWGLGCVMTRTCCGAVEWRSQASDVPQLSREARFSAPTGAAAQKSRQSEVLTFLARDSHFGFMLTCVEPRLIWRRVGIGFYRF